MKCIFPVILMLLVVCGSAAADDYISINLENGGNLSAGSHVELVFSLTYECPTVDPMAGLSLGFHIHTTGSATFSHTSGDYTKYHDTDWFNVGGIICQESDLIGTDLTSGDILFGGAYNSLFPGDGLPVGTVDEAFITVGIDLGTGTGQLCIDSAFVPPGGSWKFSNMTCGQGGAGDRPLFLDSNLSDAYHPICVNIVEAVCDPPIITYLSDGASMYANHCNEFNADFQADPGGGMVLTWGMLSGPGTINPLTGSYSSGELLIDTHTVVITVANDCSPPQYDTCQFTIIADTAPGGGKLIGPGSNAKMRFGRDRVWGPEGAESLTVVIELDGPVSILESLGIKPNPSPTRKNIYWQKISVEDYDVLKQTKGVIRVTPKSIIVKPLGTTSTLLDTSAVYFQADIARDSFDVNQR